MAKIPFPEEERRGEAVRLACRILLSCEARFLPPDPAALAENLDIGLMPMSRAAEAEKKNAYAFIRHTVGEEAMSLSAGGRYLIAYDDTVRSQDRIRFSILHEFGHILMRHFENWNLDALSADQRRLLEDEANTFARNLLCPPPILDLARNPADSRLRRLFCLSERAWRARQRTLAIDRRMIDQETADRLRAALGDYVFGRRCRDCGMVFADPERRGRCPACGCRFLVWNPMMESREKAALRKHAALAQAEDLKPRIGQSDPDLSGYWRLVRKEATAEDS